MSLAISCFFALGLLPLGRPGPRFLYFAVLLPVRLAVAAARSTRIDWRHSSVAKASCTQIFLPFPRSPRTRAWGMPVAPKAVYRKRGGIVVAGIVNRSRKHSAP